MLREIEAHVNTMDIGDETYAFRILTRRPLGGHMIELGTAIVGLVFFFFFLFFAPIQWVMDLGT